MLKIVFLKEIEPNMFITSNFRVAEFKWVFLLNEGRNFLDSISSLILLILLELHCTIHEDFKKTLERV